jgi:hypothetical protein
MYLIAWYQRASLDGNIDSKEITEAVQGAFQAAGIPIKIKVPVFELQK